MPYNGGDSDGFENNPKWTADCGAHTAETYNTVCLYKTQSTNNRITIQEIDVMPPPSPDFRQACSQLDASAQYADYTLSDAGLVVEPLCSTHQTGCAVSDLTAPCVLGGDTFQCTGTLGQQSIAGAEDGYVVSGTNSLEVAACAAQTGCAAADQTMR